MDAMMSTGWKPRSEPALAPIQVRIARSLQRATTPSPQVTPGPPPRPVRAGSGRAAFAALAMLAMVLAAVCRESPEVKSEPKSKPAPNAAPTKAKAKDGSSGAGSTQAAADRTAGADRTRPAVPVSVPADTGPPPDARPITGGFKCERATMVGGDGSSPRLRTAPPARVQLPETASGGAPFSWRGLARHQGTLYVTGADEVRRVTRAGSGWELSLVAGQNQAESNQAARFRAGAACADARFVSLGSLAAMSDGSLVVADVVSNAVVRITDPDDPKACYVHYVSGTSDTMTKRRDENQRPIVVPSDIDSTGLAGKRSPNAGNGDGDAAHARHHKPMFPVVIGNRIYVLEHDHKDRGRRIIRGIELDPETGRAADVGTVARIDNVERAQGMTAIGGSLFVAVVFDNEGIVYEINPGTGIPEDRLRGDRAAWDAEQGRSLELSGLTNCDGFLCAWSGYRVYAIDPTQPSADSAGALTLIAGAGNLNPRGGTFNVFDSSYDGRTNRPALEAALPWHVSATTTRALAVAMLYDPEAKVLWLSSETRRSAYLMRLSGCARTKR